MRGSDRRAGELFSYVNLEERVRANHPPRTILKVVSAALEALSADFAALYSRAGRPPIAPEMLLRAMLLLQAFYSIRSERQLMERLEFDLLFRWVVGIGVDEIVQAERRRRRQRSAGGRRGQRRGRDLPLRFSSTGS